MVYNQYNFWRIGMEHKDQYHFKNEAFNNNGISSRSKSYMINKRFYFKHPSFIGSI